MFITQAGIVALQAQVEANRARCAPHHELGATLATWLSRNGRACWTNIELKVRNAESLQLVRPDVFSINATLDPQRVDVAVHEVKVSAVATTEVHWSRINQRTVSRLVRYVPSVLNWVR